MQSPVSITIDRPLTPPLLPPRSARRSRWLSLAALAVTLLGLVNVLNNRVAPQAYLITCPATAALLLAFARSSGLTWAELGLSRRSRARGLRYAAVAVGAVALLYTVAISMPFTRAAFLDHRAGSSLGHALLHGLLPVLVGTVLLEEVAFRGVLWAMINRAAGPVWATAGSSLLFGLWHVLPSLRMAANNQAVGAVLGAGRPVHLVLFAVGSTAVAGVLFCELRRRSGSLLAPMGLHWATNGLGYVFAALAWSM